MSASLEAIRPNIDHWDERVDLAAAFRWTVRLNMHEGVANHFSLAVSDDGQKFLMNPNQRHFSRIKASDLLLLDAGNPAAMDQPDAPDPTAWFLHGALHRHVPQARCVMHVHPPYLTALSLMEGGRLELSHHNDLVLDDRIVYDDEAHGPVHDNDEGDRIARLMGDKTIMVMANHGVTVVGPTVHDAFDELYLAERTCMYQLTARMAGGTLRRQPDQLRQGYRGAWSDRFDARLHLDAWRRLLDREEPDYAT